MFHLAFSFPNEHSIFKTKLPIKYQADCSNSSILSIASHIVEHFPNLIPPNQSQYSISSEGQRGPCSDNSYHPYFQLWTNYVLTSFLKGNAALLDYTTYVEVSLPIELRQFLQVNLPSLYTIESMQLYAHLSPQARISTIFKIGLTNKKRKMAIFDNSAPYKQDDPYLPRINDPAILIGAIFNNEQWSIFNIGKGSIPSIEQIMVFDGVILTGSEYSVLDMNLNMQTMINNLIQAYRKREDMKILGICYGHQVISQYFNSAIMKKDKKIGIQQIEFDAVILKKHSFLQPIRETPGLMSQFHEDFVEDIPKGFDLIGKSKSCQAQMLLSQDSRILTVQFHAEYSFKFTQAYVRRTSYYFKEFKGQFFYECMNGQIQRKHLADCERLIKVYSLFLAS